MSGSAHPIAARLGGVVDGPTKLLATVMGLPLVDGIFAAVVLADGLATTLGVVQVGLLVFGGSATVAVIFGEFERDRRPAVARVLTVGVPLVVLAALQAALAPTIGSVLDLVTFERFAALVILAVAAKTVSARLGEFLPTPGAIVALGLVASVRPTSLELVVSADPALVVRGAAAAAVGVTFALGVVLARPYIADVMDIDRFRFGSAVALGMLAVSLFRPEYAFAPLAVLVVASLLAFDPDAAARRAERAASTDGGQADDPTPTPQPDDDVTVADDHGRTQTRTQTQTQGTADGADPDAAGDTTAGDGSEEGTETADETAEAGPAERPPYL